MGADLTVLAVHGPAAAGRHPRGSRLGAHTPSSPWPRAPAEPRPPPAARPPPSLGAAAPTRAPGSATTLPRTPRLTLGAPSYRSPIPCREGRARPQPAAAVLARVQPACRGSGPPVVGCRGCLAAPAAARPPRAAACSPRCPWPAGRAFMAWPADPRALRPEGTRGGGPRAGFRSHFCAAVQVYSILPPGGGSSPGESDETGEAARGSRQPPGWGGETKHVILSGAGDSLGAADRARRPRAGAPASRAESAAPA